MGEIMSIAATRSNRIVDAVDRMCVQIADRIKDGLTTAKAVEETGKALDMSFEEHFKFQELKSGAMGSILTTEEAQSLYRYLGESVSVFNGQPVEVKAVLTQVFQSLLEARIARKV